MNVSLVELLSGTIASVWDVEVLLLLRQNRLRAWNEEELVRELRSSQQVVDQSLNRLERGGLVARTNEGTVSYSPATDELRVLVEQLSDQYRLRPDWVRRTIVLDADRKLKSFSDAFLFRKPPE